MQNVLGLLARCRPAPPTYRPRFGVAHRRGHLLATDPRIGTRPMIVAARSSPRPAIFWLSRIPVHGSYVSDLLPGLLIMSSASARSSSRSPPPPRPACRPTRPDSPRPCINTSQRLGGALGLAIFSAIATSRTHHLLVENASPGHALAAGFHRALFASSLFLLAAAAIATRATNTRGEPEAAVSPAPPGTSWARRREPRTARLARRDPQQCSAGTTTIGACDRASNSLVTVPSARWSGECGSAPTTIGHPAWRAEAFVSALTGSSSTISIRMGTSRTASSTSSRSSSMRTPPRRRRCVVNVK